MRTLFLLLLLPSAASAQRLAIAANKMNVCYISVDNPLSAAAFGCTDKSLVLHTDNGEMIKNTDGYIYRPARPGVTEIAAYCVKGRDSVLMGKVTYRIKDLPLPRPCVGGKSGGPIRKAVLMARLGIEARLEAFDIDATYKVTSYEFSARKSGTVGTSITAGSAYFTPEIKAIFQSLNAGDQIYFDNIKFAMPDGRIRNAGSLTFIIE